MIIKTKSLYTSRLFLKPITINNISEKYIIWLNDIEVNQFLESRFKYHTMEDVIQYVSEINQMPDCSLYGIYLKNKTYIGNIKLSLSNSIHGRAEIGLFIGEKKEWGKGYATEAIEELSRFGFQNKNYKKLSAGCYKSNIGSRRAFENAGYKVEGILKSHVILNSVRDDVILLGLTK